MVRVELTYSSLRVKRRSTPATPANPTGHSTGLMWGEQVILNRAVCEIRTRVTSLEDWDLGPLGEYGVCVVVRASCGCVLTLPPASARS